MHGAVQAEHTTTREGAARCGRSVARWTNVARTLVGQPAAAGAIVIITAVIIIAIITATIIIAIVISTAAAVVVVVVVVAVVPRRPCRHA